MWFCSQVWWLSSSVELPRRITHTIICQLNQEVALSRQGCLSPFVHCTAVVFCILLFLKSSFIAWPLTCDCFLPSSLRYCTSWQRTSYFPIWVWHCLLSRNTYSAQFSSLELLYPFLLCVRFLCLTYLKTCGVCWLYQIEDGGWPAFPLCLADTKILRTIFGYPLHQIPNASVPHGCWLCTWASARSHIISTDKWICFTVWLGYWQPAVLMLLLYSNFGGLESIHFSLHFQRSLEENKQTSSK